MSLLRTAKKAFTMEERLYNFALVNKCEIEKAVMEIRRIGGSPTEREIAGAKAKLWRLREIDRKSRMYDPNWRD